MAVSCLTYFDGFFMGSNDEDQLRHPRQAAARDNTMACLPLTDG